MIVWGGRGTNGVLNTGARYDPISDSWRPVSVVQAPPHRAGAAVFWTGNRMIVWGGWPSPQADGGGLYNPVTDSWTAMSTVGSLPGGPWPPAVWAGDQMIVMSRSCGTDSRRYVLETNTWSSIPSYRDPVWGCVGPSNSTTKTWTGKELILWQGNVQKGAKYDPALGRWTSVSSTNAPSARMNHSVVWTGELMIVWGGDAGSSGASVRCDCRCVDPDCDILGSPGTRFSHRPVDRKRDDRMGRRNDILTAHLWGRSIRCADWTMEGHLQRGCTTKRECPMDWRRDDRLEGAWHRWSALQPDL